MPLTVGVGSKAADVRVDRRVGPVLFEDGLREGVVVAEEVLDVSEGPLGCEGEASDAGEEIDVAKSLPWLGSTICGSHRMHCCRAARSWENAMRFLPHPRHTYG